MTDPNHLGSGGGAMYCRRTVNPSTLKCSNCGALVPLPADADATFASCQHCQFTLPMPAEWVEMRRRQQAALDDRHRQAAQQAAELKANKSSKRLRVLVTIGVLAGIGLIGSFVAMQLSRGAESAQLAQQHTAQRQAQSEARLQALQPLLNSARKQGCAREVEAPDAVIGAVRMTLTMRAGGHCVHALMTAAGSIRASIISPSGQSTPASGQAALEMEYCPAETGEHRFEVSNPSDSVMGLALVECPSAFEAHKNDPEKNGLARVQKQLAALQKEGCGRIIMPPKSVTGRQSLTGKMSPGAFCSVLVAAAGTDSNPLSLTLTSPLGDVVKSIKRRAQWEVAHCAGIAGDHAIVVEPTTLDYFTVAGMECPERVARKHGAR